MFRFYVCNCETFGTLVVDVMEDETLFGNNFGW